MLHHLRDEEKIHGAKVTKVELDGYNPRSAIEIDFERKILSFCFEHTPERPGAQLDALMQAGLLMVDGILRRNYSEQLMKCKLALQEAISYYEISKLQARRERREQATQTHHAN